MRCSPPAAPKSSIDVSAPVPEEVLHQLDALELDPDRPLLICDADEVLFAFVRGLEHYLNDQGLELRLETFALTGNIRDAGSGEPLAAGDVRELLQRFFAERTESLEPIEGARDALAISLASLHTSSPITWRKHFGSPPIAPRRQMSSAYFPSTSGMLPDSSSSGAPASTAACSAWSTFSLSCAPHTRRTRAQLQTKRAMRNLIHSDRMSRGVVAAADAAAR